MQFFGRVEHMEQIRSGISKTTGQGWKSAVVVIQDPNSKKAVAVSIFGENNIKKFKKGLIGTITYSTYVREYTDKNGVTRYTCDNSFDSWEEYTQQHEDNPFPTQEEVIAKTVEAAALQLSPLQEQKLQAMTIPQPAPAPSQPSSDDELPF